MSVKNTKDEEQLKDVDPSSVDTFIKELEEKEKDLDISSDLVIEIDDSDVEHDNIHDSFISMDVEPSMPGQISPTDSLIDKEVIQPNPVEGLKAQVVKLKEERDHLKDAIVRRQRDFDNYRKRTERKRGDALTSVVSNVAAQTLPVIDNMNRALDAFSDADGDAREKDFDTFLEGIVLVNQQLNEVLSSMGVQPIPAVGEPFDPIYHDAVETEETDEHPPATVISEVLRGYKVNDRVIRASMVKVSFAKKSEED